METVTVIPYEPRHRDAFRDLNEAWIKRYFKLEEPDRRALNDPEGYILQKGGYIFMAEYAGEAVGACALINEGNSIFELAKMAVADHVQGRGIGYALGMACIEKARDVGYEKVELLSNTKLERAIRLYRRLGFMEVPLPHTEYERANIKMEIRL
jgi:GNAT superfamily N-acetyltransferase